MYLKSEMSLPPCWALLQIRGKCIRVLSGRKCKSYFRMTRTQIHRHTRRNTHTQTHIYTETHTHTQRHAHRHTHVSFFLYNNLFLTPQLINQQWKHSRGSRRYGCKVGTPEQGEGSVFSGMYYPPGHLPVGRVWMSSSEGWDSP